MKLIYYCENCDDYFDFNRCPDCQNYPLNSPTSLENKKLKDIISDLKQEIIELELNQEDMPTRLEYEDLD